MKDFPVLQRAASVPAATELANMKAHSGLVVIFRRRRGLGRGLTLGVQLTQFLLTEPELLRRHGEAPQGAALRAAGELEPLEIVSAAAADLALFAMSLATPPAAGQHPERHHGRQDKDENNHCV